MPYQVDRYNGALFSEVPDQTVDSSSSDLKFVGKNYAGYGEVLNENFLHLLENFRGTTQPRKAIPGQLWYDETSNKIKFKSTDNQFRTLSITDVTNIPPVGLLSKDTGNLWYDTQKKQISVWDGSNYVLIGPEIAVGFGETRLSSGTIRDNTNVEHEIINVNSDGTTVATITSDEFEIGNISSIPGFTTLKKGITLVDTPTDGVTTSNFRFWGTASNSEKFQGLVLSDFVLRGVNGSTFDDSGVTLGTDNDFKLHVVDGNKVVLENLLGNTIRVRITSGAVTNDVAVFETSGIIPGATNLYNLGSNTIKWNEIHSSTIYGNVVGTAKGNILANDNTVLVDGTIKQINAKVVGPLYGNVYASDATIAYDGSTKTLTTVNAVITNIQANTLSIVDRIDGDLKGDMYANDDSIAYNASTKIFYANTFQGNASTASKLDTPKYINGVAFDGSQNITIVDSGAVRKSGDTVVGNISSTASPSAEQHLVTKGYVDTAIDTAIKSREIALTLDTRGLSTTGVGSGTVVNMLNAIAPPANYMPGTLARVSGTEQNVSSTVSAPKARWISVYYVYSVSVTTTVSNPSRNNNLVYRINSSGTSWEYVSG
jgi:hypothetical protein